jgi:hypothetical protein
VVVHDHRMVVLLADVHPCPRPVQPSLLRSRCLVPRGRPRRQVPMQRWTRSSQSAAESSGKAGRPVIGSHRWADH